MIIVLLMPIILDDMAVEGLCGRWGCSNGNNGGGGGDAVPGTIAGREFILHILILKIKNIQQKSKHKKCKKIILMKEKS
jgi:hypothetical protein